MIARNLQELADAANTLEIRLMDTGVEPTGYHPRRLRMAQAFAEELRLVSNDGQVAELVCKHPIKAEAFLSILRSVRKELEEEGIDISDVPDVPLLLYAPVADAVFEAARAYRKRKPYVPLLLAQLRASQAGPVRRQA
jgi:hypothetical protein